ncbi:MAG: hypothetical protein JO346_02030 [Alphaproteobacteria bacterium]|nr:hypothetical protein [Alphaproteobacteria bacterium]
MSDAPSTPQLSNRDPNARWQFLRDVAVFELKLALNNLHNFFQIPLTLAVAAFDVIAGGKQEGERFYKLVEMGRTIDDSIDIYSIIDHRERSLNKDYTVDAGIKRLEDVIVKEYEKGGTAATIRHAVDRAIDDMQSRSGDTLGKAGDAMKSAADKIHEKMQKMGDPPQAPPAP